MNRQEPNDRFPAEILLNILSYLDGKTLVSCKKTCRQWHDLIAHYDDIIWPHACHVDFKTAHHNVNRFWSLHFPKPITPHQKWQDMYRITFNWYRGYAKGFYTHITTDNKNSMHPFNVIGSPQEQNLFTTLTLSYDKRIIRSNPNYGHLLIQSPETKHTSILSMMMSSSEQELPSWATDTDASIVCHYSHPSSPYLVTGTLNGTVAVWNLVTKALVRVWQGHRGRVLCVSMNDQVIVSGGSDCIIRVWDIENPTTEWTNHHRPARRGMIDISSYLSGQNEWLLGVGEITVNQHLIACAPDASGPILVFSLLTGSLVYELRQDRTTTGGEEMMMTTALTRLCLTPFFLLTKGRITTRNHNKGEDTASSVVPSNNNVILQRQQMASSVNYASETPSNMTPYQLARYFEQQHQCNIPTTSACINVWDLQTGKIAYRLLPTLENPSQHYIIGDIRLSPDYSKLFASIEVGNENRLYCWDFSITHEQQQHQQDFEIIELDQPDIARRKTGKSWVCFT